MMIMMIVVVNVVDMKRNVVQKGSTVLYCNIMQVDVMNINFIVWSVRVSGSQLRPVLCRMRMITGSRMCHKFTVQYQRVEKPIDDPTR